MAPQPVRRASTASERRAPAEDVEIDEGRTRPADGSTEADQTRRQLRQKNTVEEANIVLDALGGKDDFSCKEAFRKSAPQLIGYSTASREIKYDLDDHAWISSHWKSSPQKRKADMGDPMAVNAEMTEAIASTAERMSVQDRESAIGTVKLLKLLRSSPPLRPKRQKVSPLKFPSI